MGLWFQDIPTPAGKMAPPYLAIGKEPTGEVRVNGDLLQQRFGFTNAVYPAVVDSLMCYNDSVSYVVFFWLFRVLSGLGISGEQDALRLPR